MSLQKLQASASHKKSNKNDLNNFHVVYDMKKNVLTYKFCRKWNKKGYVGVSSISQCSRNIC